MTPVYQTTVDKGDGDCMRAVVASLLDLTIEEVPHFLRYKDRWNDMYLYFMEFFGYEYSGNNSPGGVFGDPKHEDSIKGYFYTVVPSSLYEGNTHAVIMDTKGIIVHDPNPNQHFKGMTMEEAGVMYWHMFEKGKQK